MIIADYDLCVCSRFFVPQRKPTLQFTGSQGNSEKLQSPPYNCSARCYQVRALCVCSSWPGFLQLAKYENKLFLLTRTDKKIARISLQTLLIRTKNWRNETVFQTSNFDQNQARVVLTTIWGLWILSATFFRSVSSECEALDQRVRRVTQKIYNATPTSPGPVDTGS